MPESASPSPVVPPAVASPLKIKAIAERLGLGDDDWEPQGWFKGKLALGLEGRLPPRAGAKLIGVSAVNPTPYGEGKTVAAIGLAMALCRLGHAAIATLRQPSQAPVFGVKGGGAGGGRAALCPADEINLHFTGDAHAVAAANNLLAAMIDNHLKRRKTPRLCPETVGWRRVLDVSDKGLSSIVTGLGDRRQAPLRETGFDLTAASEVMAILALATSLEDLRRRLGRIFVGMTEAGKPAFAEDIGCAGAMAALLRDALRPNLVQTCEQTPALVHAGPFGNIAHGNSSVLADVTALRLADFVVTESGFGADCGAEKFFHIKCRTSGLRPSVEVLVCSVRALKYQSGRFRVVAGKPLPAELERDDEDALRAGSVNLQAHLEILRQFGLPVVVAVNRFPHDSSRELDLVCRIARDNGAAAAAVIDAFAEGGRGAEDLAQAVTAACKEPSELRWLYDLEMSPAEKIEALATRVYGAERVDFEPLAKRRMEQFVELGFGRLPVCIAKTQYSLSHDPKLLGRPRGFRFPIRDVRLASGAGFLYALAGEINTMPGLPAEPAALAIDVYADGTIRGLR
ncbi:MAG TPA: formate--tetrahydrofolate ligase [Pirellulales bacterium]|nr:formate--tetrahydrofolate ligase [Pirellulales bacterium]